MKSLELNWIRNVDKSLVIPEVVFSSLSWAGGIYHHPKRGEILIDDKFYSLDYGVIEVPEKFGGYGPTLAHEWRHHWQHYNGWKFDQSYLWPEEFNPDEYDSLIVKYFTSNHHEMDALRFEYEYTTIHEKWEKLLYNYLW